MEGISKTGGTEAGPVVVLFSVMFEAVVVGVARTELSDKLSGETTELNVEELAEGAIDDVFKGTLEDRLSEDEGTAKVKLLLVSTLLLGFSTPMVLVTGQMVVVRDTSSVVTCPLGQFVTDGGHAVTV